MKIRILFTAILCLLSLAAPLWAAGEQNITAPPVKTPGESTEIPGSYIIGPGDLLDISVWKDESLTRTVVVLPDGRISFPLVGQFMAAGRTLADIRQEMEGRLARYVPDVVLSLDVKQVNSLIIYVLGRINNPGRFILNTNINVMQALATAGGLNPFAKKDEIKIFRHEGSKTTIFNFDYSDVSEGEHLEQNIQLMRGDVIVVP
ncbi:MAG: polysaccharide biosynthesis/export family protein [Pseudomonadota bacterium]